CPSARSSPESLRATRPWRLPRSSRPREGAAGGSGGGSETAVSRGSLGGNQALSSSYASALLSRRKLQHLVASSDSPIASAARAKAARQRRKPWFGACDHGTGPWPFHP